MLHSAGVDLMVVEATDRYERGLMCALQHAVLCVARVPASAFNAAAE